MTKIIRRFAPPILLSICALIAGYSLYRVTHQTPTHATTPAVATNDRQIIGELRPSINLPDLRQQPRSLDEWQHKVLIINFWATWCPPCREEIPDFIALQNDYAKQNVQFIGIAIDRPETVMRFVEDYAINYPILHGQQEAIEIGRQYGNRSGALPYTVLVDGDGVIRHIHDQGVLHRTQLEPLIEKLLPGNF